MHAGTTDQVTEFRPGDKGRWVFDLTFNGEGVAVTMPMPDENAVIAWGD